MKIKRILAICLVMLLVAVAMPLVVNAQSTQTWYLSGTITAVSGADRIMYKGNTTRPADIELLEYGKNWNADQAAQESVSFPAGDWDGQISLSSGKTNTYKVSVGEVSGGSFTAYAEETIIGGGTGVESFSISAPALTVLSGGYLAFQIYNESGGGPYVMVGGSSTYVQSPATDPGYVPELPTIILLATGLLFLAGYFGLKRRKRAFVKA